MSAKKNKIDIKAPAGNVMTQERKILLMTRILREAKPLAMPTPNTAPTKTWVVETGKPVYDASTTVVAAANSAEKPRLGVYSVILLPIVFMTLKPNVASPKTIPPPPTSNIHDGSTLLEAICPPDSTIL